MWFSFENKTSGAPLNVLFIAGCEYIRGEMADSFLMDTYSVSVLAVYWLGLPLIIDSLWVKEGLSTGAIGVLEDLLVVKTKIWKRGWVPVDDT